MEILIMTIIAFVLCYLMYFLLVIKNKKQLEKYRTSKEVLYLESKYSINIDKIPNKTLAKDLSLVNSLIVAITFAVSELIDNMWLKLLVIFLVLMVLIFVSYHFVGKAYIRKYGRKPHYKDKQ